MNLIMNTAVENLNLNEKKNENKNKIETDK